MLCNYLVVCWFVKLIYDCVYVLIGCKVFVNVLFFLVSI